MMSSFVTCHERLAYLRNLEEKKAAGTGKHRGAGKADRGAQKADLRGADTGSSR